MLINYVPGEESRIAIVHEGRLEEFYQERASSESHVGNIYKGKVTNVEPSIQAAFIDFGLERNGFLHITDLHPMYFPGKDREEFEQVGSKTPHRERPPVQKCLRRGQEVLVQVLKEGISSKGPTLTSYLSIPGRFVVMMPQMQRLGVSRKVDDDDARREARKLLAELDPPEGFGFIVRTAGIGQTKTDLKRDLAYLQRLWKNIEQRRASIGKVGELYTESDLVIRTIRDVFSTDIDRILVDDPTAARRAYDFLAIASPRSRSKVVYYNDPVPLFHRFDIERQIESIHAREVPLPSGGSLVIDQTEALVAIDVNSGKSRDARDAESNAFNTDKEAVDEIARQLRLRDLGGVVVLDLIDMRDLKHRRQIEQRFRQNIKNDRARTRIGPISQFGLLEMTRQRMRPSLETSFYNACEHCSGMGQVKSPESVVLDVMRRLALVIQHEKVDHLELTISPDVAFQLLNRKRQQLTRLEARFRKQVMVRVGGQTIDYVNVVAFDARGGQIDIDALLTPGKPGSPGKLPKEIENAYVDLSAGQPLPEADLDEDESLYAEDEAMEAALAGEPAEAVPAAPGEASAEDGDDEGPGRKKRRRRRRRGRKKTGEQAGDEQAPEDAHLAVEHKDEDEASRLAAKRSGALPEGVEGSSETAESRLAAERSGARSDESTETATAEHGEEGSDTEQTTKRRRRRRRGGRGRRRSNSQDSTEGEQQSAQDDNGTAPHPKESPEAPESSESPEQAPESAKSSPPPEAPETPEQAPEALERAPKPSNTPKAREPKKAPAPAAPVGKGYSNRLVDKDAG